MCLIKSYTVKSSTKIHINSFSFYDIPSLETLLKKFFIKNLITNLFTQIKKKVVLMPTISRMLLSYLGNCVSHYSLGNIQSLCDILKNNKLKNKLENFWHRINFCK